MSLGQGAGEGPDLRETARILATSALHKGASIEGWSKLASRVAGLVDRQLSLVGSQEGAEPIVCKPGCSHCCHMMVLASPPEIARVFEFVRSWSADQKEGLLGRIEALNEAAETHRPEWFLRFRHPCPFLVDQQCTVHEHRPLFCRGLTSSNVELCKLTKLRPAHDQLFGPNGEQVFSNEVRAGLLEAQQIKTPLEMARMVGLLLKDPSLEATFLSEPPALEAPKVRPWRMELPDAGQEWQGDLIPDPAFAELINQRRDRPTRELLHLSNPPSAGRIIARLSVASAFESEAEVEEEWTLYQEAIAQAEELNWDAREAYLALAKYQPIGVGYLVKDVRPSMERIGRLLHEKVAKVVAPELLAPMGARKAGKLRFGVLGDVGGNSGSDWVLPWVREMDRRDFETYVFKVHGTENAVSYEFKAAADHYFRLFGPPTEIARFVRSLDLDYLLLPDAGDRGISNQLCIFRMARRQAAGWGTPFTTGHLETIDDFLSSEASEPKNADEHYGERLVRLPGIGLTLERPAEIHWSLHRGDFGLPNGLLVAYPQYSIKWLPSFDGLFEAISDSLQTPILFIRYGRGREIEVLKRLMAKNVKHQWVSRLPAHRFRAMLPLLDVCLDGPGWSGGLTAMHSLTQGVPFVNWPGQFFRQRLAKGFCEAAGVPDLMVDSAEDYVVLALDPERLAEIRTRIQPEGIFDDLRPLRALEDHIRATSEAS